MAKLFDVDRGVAKYLLYLHHPFVKVYKKGLMQTYLVHFVINVFVFFLDFSRQLRTSTGFTGCLGKENTTIVRKKAMTKTILITETTSRFLRFEFPVAMMESER